MTTVVIVNLVTIKHNETSANVDARVTFGKKVENLQYKLKIRLNTITKDQNKEKLEQSLNKHVTPI